MGLAGEQEVDRLVLLQQDVGQAADVVEDQVGALVGGEATRKAEGKHPGLEPLALLQAGQVVGRIDPGFGHLLAVAAQHGVDKGDQSAVVPGPGLLQVGGERRQVFGGDGGKAAGVVAPVA